MGRLPKVSAWYVLWYEARTEKEVAERLIVRGYSVWLPTVTERHRWSDRWKIITRSLLPGNLFAATRVVYVHLQNTLGFLTLVKEGIKPEVLTSDYISGLRHLIENPDFAVKTVTREQFAPGD
jgi:Transcription termination factor nusG